MRALRVVYAGTGLSGKHTSLASVLTGWGRPTTWTELDALQRQLFRITVDGLQEDVVARVSRLLCGGASRPDEARRLLLGDEGKRLAECDGVVFVADSQELRRESNEQAFQSLKDDLESRGSSIHDKAIVFQANKRDLPTACPMDRLRQDFSAWPYTWVESIATQGVGTHDAMQELVRLIRQRRRGQ